MGYLADERLKAVGLSNRRRLFGLDNELTVIPFCEERKMNRAGFIILLRTLSGTFHFPALRKSSRHAMCLDEARVG